MCIDLARAGIVPWVILALVFVFWSAGVVARQAARRVEARRGTRQIFGGDR